MPGYLRPHIQTTFPGPDDQRQKSDQNQEGRPGWYWVELTFQPNPILFSEAEQILLRQDYIGDSLLILSDPLPVDEDRKHIFTIKAQPDALEYFVYCNQKGRLSHINFRHHASCFAEAIRVAREKIQPFLSGWSVHFNVPLYVFRIRALEESTNVVRTIFYHQLYAPVHVSSAETNRLYWFPGDTRVISFYHDALNATSPSYQFLCYFKVTELVLGLRGKRAAEAKQKGNVKIRQRDVFRMKIGLACIFQQSLQPN